MSQKTKILLIEDDHAIREMYKLKFAQRKIEVTIAEDGRQALKYALRMRPELLLLDLRIPKFDGVEVLEKLRRYEWGKKMKVVILSNISETEAPQKLGQLHYDQYFVKAHTTPTKVVDAIRQYL